MKDPAALGRRMHGGPTAETRTVQKIAICGTIVSVVAVLVVSALDHRFAWSHVPMPVVLLGDGLVAVGLGIAMLVVIQNSYAAATITVEAEQEVVSTSLYGLVRHPMYVGALIIMIGTPLALDSYWGLGAIVPGLLAIAFRIRDEENMLRQELGAGISGARLITVPDAGHCLNWEARGPELLVDIIGSFQEQSSTTRS